MKANDLGRLDLLLYHAMEGGVSPDEGEELRSLVNRLKDEAARRRPVKTTGPEYNVTVNGVVVLTAPAAEAYRFAASLARQVAARYPENRRERDADHLPDAIEAAGVIADMIEAGELSTFASSHVDPYPHRTVIEVKAVTS